MSKAPPLCRYCGGPLRKYTTTVYFKETPGPNDHKTAYSSYVYYGDKGRPQTKAEAQRYINQQIVSTKRETTWSDAEDKRVDLGIAYVGVWDGERYYDDYFCNGDHARRFARVMAKNGRQTDAHYKAVQEQKLQGMRRIEVTIETVGGETRPLELEIKKGSARDMEWPKK